MEGSSVFAMTFYCPLREHHSWDQLVFLTGLLTVLFFLIENISLHVILGHGFPFSDSSVSHFSPLHTSNSIAFLFLLRKQTGK